jgi:putative IMPACT (imprinted ancient) family translation regulator
MNRLTGIARFEQTIRNSRFIGVCGPVENEAEAAGFIAEHGAPGCRHVCYAWKIGDRLRFNDAGEPGGTAGRPILAALEHFELDYAIVVVSRFFGGVKLGTGGLARAYGGTAMEVLALAPIEAIVPMRRLRCAVPFASAGELHALAERVAANKLDEHWSGNGLELVVELPALAHSAFVEELTALTRGAARVELMENAERG